MTFKHFFIYCKFIRFVPLSGFFQNATFTNCSCVGEQNGPSLVANGSAVAGICDAECKLIGIFLFVLSVGVLLEFMRVVPFVFVTMRLALSR